MEINHFLFSSFVSLKKVEKSISLVPSLSFLHHRSPSPSLSATTIALPLGHHHRPPSLPSLSPPLGHHHRPPSRPIPSPPIRFIRYDQGLTINVDDINYSSGASSAESSWRLVPTQMSSTSLMESRTDSYLQTKSPQLTMVNAFEPVMDATTPGSKPSQQQHCLFGSKLESPVKVKHEQQHMMRPFFDEWPETREPWSSLDAGGGATTQLSMSTVHEYSSRND